MNPFADLENDEVFVIDERGHRQGPYKTAFNSKKLTIFNETLDINDGDKIVRALPNVKEDIYTVVESSYNSAFHGIPGHYSLKLRKDSALSNEGHRTVNKTVNINNSTGFQVGDGNVQNITDCIQSLVENIESFDVTNEEKMIARSKIKEMLSNPTVAAILGGSVSSLLSLL